MNTADINPFASFGNPVKPEKFSGRSSNLRMIKDRVGTGNSTIVEGERRIGKTSLADYIYSMGENIFSQPKEKFLIVKYDCITKVNITVKEFWIDILTGIYTESIGMTWTEELKNIILDFQNNDNPNYEPKLKIDNIFNTIKQNNNQIVFIFDEFDVLVGSENLPITFFNYLRQISGKYRVAFILFSRTRLISFVRREISGSPFLNTMATSPLIGFTKNEFTEWMQNKLSNSSIIFSEDLVKYLESVSGRFPFFAEMGGYYIYEALLEKPDIKINEIKRIFDNSFANQAEIHFISYWNHSTDIEKIKLAILAVKQPSHILHKKFYDDSTIDHLINRSLIIQNETKYEVFSTYFCDFIKKEFLSQLNSSDDFNLFVDEYKDNLPKERIKKMSSSIAGALAKIDPKYYEAILKLLLVNNPEDLAALNSVLQ